MSSPSMTRALRRLLLGCGIASSLLYIAMNAFLPLLFEGYSYRDQTVSELSAIGAPTRALWVPLALAYEALVIAFGLGVWGAADRNKRLRVTGGTLMAYGIIGAFWPPMHLRETLAAGGGTLTDTLHIAWTMVVVPLMIVAMGFGAAALGKRFRAYSIATISILAAFGAVTGVQSGGVAANLPTPLLGASERISIAAFILWVVVLAVELLRALDDPANEGYFSRTRSISTSPSS